MTLSIRAPAIGHDQTSRRRWAALVVVCLAALIINVDNTILNVALPTLVRDLRATSSELQWIVDSYAMVFAGLLFVGGSLADRFGRRRFFLIGLTVFAGFERPDDPTIEFHLGHGDRCVEQGLGDTAPLRLSPYLVSRAVRRPASTPRSPSSLRRRSSPARTPARRPRSRCRTS